MITHIHIENFTLVESLSLDFYPHMNILTGETGAGKSIWVDAVLLALGDRADTSVIRQGADRCDISVCFDISDSPAVKAWLEEHALYQENDCILRRMLHREGRSRLTINGKPCPLQMMRELRPKLLLIHGQHQHQALLKPEQQRALIDTYAGNDELLTQLQQLYQQWRLSCEQQQTLQAKAHAAKDQLHLFEYQIQELDELNLQENEWQQLSQQHQRLHNAKQFIQELQLACELTQESESASALSLTQQALDHMSAIKSEDTQLNSIRELLNTALIHLQEAGTEMNHYQRNLELSPEHLHQIEMRLSLIHDLARKHHVNPEALISVHQSLRQKMDALKNIDTHLENLADNIIALEKQYQLIAKKLTLSREKAAKHISHEVTKYMQQLGMEGGEFAIALLPQKEGLHMHGLEKVHFMVSTNPGQEKNPLGKVASGGELSRLSLALQVITAQKAQTPTLIFDEVDTGIGGSTAEMVAALLQELSARAQVLCITHLAQIAAVGQHHFKAEKHTKNHSTRTSIHILQDNDRVKELARMLSGSKVSTEVLQLASEMLA